MRIRVAFKINKEEIDRSAMDVVGHSKDRITNELAYCHLSNLLEISTVGDETRISADFFVLTHEQAMLIMNAVTDSYQQNIVKNLLLENIKELEIPNLHDSIHP